MDLSMRPDISRLIYDDPQSDNSTALEYLFNTNHETILNEGILYTKRPVLITTHNKSIKGAGVEKTKIIMNGLSGDCIIIGDTTKDAYSIYFENLEISSYASSPSSVSGVNIIGGYIIFFAHCVLSNSTKYGFNVDGHAYCIRFTECQIRWNKLGGVYFYHTAKEQKNDIVFLNCMVMSNGQLTRSDDIQIGNNYNISGTSIKIIGGTVENCGGGGIHINKGCGSGLMITGVHFESGKRSCIEFEAIPVNSLIRGNYFMYDSGRVSNVWNINNLQYPPNNDIEETCTAYNYREMNSGKMYDFFSEQFSVTDNFVTGKTIIPNYGGYIITSLKLLRNANNHISLIIKPLINTTLNFVVSHYKTWYYLLDSAMGSLFHTGNLEVSEVGKDFFIVKNNTNLSLAQIQSLYDVPDSGAYIVGQNASISKGIGNVDFYDYDVIRNQDLSSNSDPCLSWYKKSRLRNINTADITIDISKGYIRFSNVTNLQNCTIGTRFVLCKNRGKFFGPTITLSKDNLIQKIEFDIDQRNIFYENKLGFYCPISRAFQLLDCKITEIQ